MNRLGEFLVTILAYAYGLVAPATFIYLIATFDSWTFWNAVPFVILASIQAAFWWAYWPLHFLFGF